MEKHDPQKLKTSIEEMIDETKADIKALKDQIKPIAPDAALGRLTRMDAISDRGVKETALNAAKIKLNKLNYALKRVGDPDFGICDMCGHPIAPARIMLVPESTTCVKCVDEK